MVQISSVVVRTVKHLKIKTNIVAETGHGVPETVKTVSISNMILDCIKWKEFRFNIKPN